MDYMLLRSGAVMAIDDEPKVPEMFELMEKHDGAAYYWYAGLHRDWYFVERDQARKGSQPVKEVPDIIKLAAMLE